MAWRTTTWVVLNGLDRLHLVQDALDYAQDRAARAAQVTGFVRESLDRHRRYIEEHGEDIPEIRERRWGARAVGVGYKK